MLEVVEGAEAGAEVVERERAAELGEPLRDAARALELPIAAVSVTSKIRQRGVDRRVADLGAMKSSTAASVIDSPDRLTSSAEVVAAALALGEQPDRLRETQRSIAWIWP